MGYKESAGADKVVFKVDRYYHIDWLAEKDLPLHYGRVDIDVVYESLIHELAGDSLASDEWIILKESVYQQKQPEQLDEQTVVLEAKTKKKNSSIERYNRRQR
ncbi:hypothetical protein [Anaerotignum faecicola]